MVFAFDGDDTRPSFNLEDFEEGLRVGGGEFEFIKFSLSDGDKHGVFVVWLVELLVRKVCSSPSTARWAVSIYALRKSSMSKVESSKIAF